MSKVIAYYSVLQDRNLTLYERLLLSQIVYRSLADGGESAYDKNGFLSPESEIPLGWSVSYKTGIPLGISVGKYYAAIRRYEQCSYIHGGIIRVPPQIDRFLELKTETGLSGSRLLVYSYIANKALEYGAVDKYLYKIAEELGIGSTSTDAETRKMSEKREMRRIVRWLMDEGFIVAKKDKRGRIGLALGDREKV